MLLALIDSLVNEAAAKIILPESIPGARGLRGRDGNDFNLEDHSETIKQFVLENIPNPVLTEEQIFSLKGSPGKDGRDGKDLSLEECLDTIKSQVFDTISNMSDKLKLKLSDLSDNELDSLKLKFSDLSEEEVNALRGPRGQKGKQGKDFSLEEAKSTIEEAVADSVMALAPDLKLKFSDLSEEEVNSLKLKFELLTEDEKLSIRGPRGQKGKTGSQGFQGEKGDKGDTVIGPQGIPGITGIGLRGKDGQDGNDGKDGNDAPKIMDVSASQVRDEVSLTFEFNDGSEITSSPFKVPSKNINQYNIYNSGGSGVSLQDSIIYSIIFG